MIALLAPAKNRFFDRSTWLPNIISGVIVGVVALPLGLAFAIASGVRPEQGIYTSIVGGLAAALLGGSQVQISGPTGAFIVILADVVAQFGPGGLLLATLMAGFMLLAMGLAKFGRAIRFIPDPVIRGFTAGIGVIIWVGQWRDFFGLPKVGGTHFYDKLYLLLRALPHLHGPTTALACLCLLLVIYGPRVPGLRRVPGPLIALVAATLITSWHPAGIATIGSVFGGIPQGLPGFHLPAFSFDSMVALLPSAFTIAMLGAIESLLSAVVADGMAGTRHDLNQELIGQGVANILSPLFGGFASTGAIARTATNVRNGGTTPLAAITHCATLMLVLLVAAPLAGRIPLCALAAILFVVSWNMSGVAGFLRLLRTAPVADAAILLITFSLTVATDLVIAVNIGVILAMLQFLRRMAASVAVVAQNPTTLPCPAPDGVLVYQIEGPLFFGAIDALEQALGPALGTPRAVILRLIHVPFMDMTGIQALEETMVRLEQRGVRVVLCEANGRVLRKLLRARLLARGHRQRYSRGLAAALRRFA